MISGTNRVFDDIFYFQVLQFSKTLVLLYMFTYIFINVLCDNSNIMSNYPLQWVVLSTFDINAPCSMF